MARTVDQIKAQMLAEKQAQSSLNALSSTSQTAFWNLYIYLVAVAINIFEQILDLFKVDIETIAYNSYPGSPQWIKQQVLNFQYSATTPQNVTYNPVTNIIGYSTINTVLRIVTRCSVNRFVNKIVVVKAAKGTTPTALTTLEKNALQSYLYDIGFAGIDYNVVSNAADKLSLTGVVYYEGAYSATIQASVITAINTYLSNIPFDGIVTTNGVIDAVTNVAGVIDFAPTIIGVRKDSVVFANRSFLYNLSSNINLVKYQTDAGYIVEETTSGQGFTNTLTFTPQ